MNKRINNVFEKYVEKCKSELYPDLSYYDSGYDILLGKVDITKQQLETFAKKQIDLFVNTLHPELIKKIKDENKVSVLCWYLKTVLFENLYNNNPSIFSLFDCMFNVTDDNSDVGMYVNFDVSFGTRLNRAGWYLPGNQPEYNRSLIIEATFFHTQSERINTFEIRCYYDQCEGQYYLDFKKYINNSTDEFLTNEVFVNEYYSGDYKLYEEEYFEGDVHDCFGVDIVELFNPAKLRKPLVNKDFIQTNVIE